MQVNEFFNTVGSNRNRQVVCADGFTMSVQAFDGGGTLEVGANTAGLFVGALAAWCRAPFAVVLVLAAAATAGLRLL